MTETHYIYTPAGKQEVEPFIEAENMTITFDFVNNVADIGFSEVTFFGKTARLIEQIRSDSSNIFTSLKYEIEFIDGSESLSVIRYLDLRKFRLEKEKNFVKVGMQRNVDETHIKDMAKAVFFDDFPNYNSIPYVISAIPDTSEICLLSFATFYIIFEFQKILEDVRADILAGSSGVGTPTSVANTVGNIVKLTILFTQGFVMIRRIIRVTVQPLKHKRFAYVRDLFDFGARRIGFSGGSETIFHKGIWRDAVIVCKSAFNPNNDNDGLRGFFSPNNAAEFDIFDKDFGFLIEEMQRFFNLKEIVPDGNKLIVDLEFIPTTASYVIDNYSNVDVYDNTDELNASLFLSFATDTNEKNTIDYYYGTSVQVSTQRPAGVVPFDQNLLTGIDYVQGYFSRAIDKRELTFPEKIVDGFLKVLQPILDVLFTVLDAIIDVVNAILRTLNRILSFLGLNFNVPTLNKPNRPNIGNLIENRIGVMLLENDFLALEKLTLINTNDTPRNRTIKDSINAERIYIDFHRRDFITNNINERRTYNSVRNRLQDFNQMTSEQALLNENNQVERVLKIEWNKTLSLSKIETEAVTPQPTTLIERRKVVGNIER